MRQLIKLGAMVFLSAIVLFANASIGSASDRADRYCSGARYTVGLPFIDHTKLNPLPGSLTSLAVDPIVKIDRVQRDVGDVGTTIAYAYFNRHGLVDLAAAPEAITTPADKIAFRQMLARIGVPQAPHSRFMQGTQFGDGYIRFWAGKRVKKALGSSNSLAECVRRSDVN